MKKLIIAAAAVAVLAMATAAGVFAQTPPAPTPPGQGWGCPGWGPGAQGNYDPSNSPTIKALADKLGIQAADLVSQLKSGKSVADVAKDKGVAEQTLIDLLQAPMVDMMNVRVKYGYMTQDQADQMKQYMAERIKWRLEQKGFLGGYGMMGPGYGMMGGPGGRGYGMMGPGGRGGMMGPGFGPRGGQPQGFSY